MDISIVIVNYNTAKLLDECLISVKEQTHVNYEIIIIDNASSDNSVEMLEKKYPEVTLIQNQTNHGFAHANNQGFAIAKGKYFLMLNPDTVVLDNALDKLVFYMDNHPNAGICSPRNQDACGKIQMNCDHFPSIMNDIFEYLNLGKKFPQINLFNRSRMVYWDYNEIKEVDRVMGCSLLIWSAIYRRVGGLDNQYFMYFEETDLCFRVKKHGYKIMFLPEASIVHYGGESSKSQKKHKLVNKTVLTYFLNSKYYFYKKNHSLLTAAFSRWVDTIYSLGIILRNTLRQKGELKSNRMKKAMTYLECLTPKLALRIKPLSNI